MGENTGLFICGGSTALCAITVCCIGFLLALILIPVSIHTVKYDEFALDYNTITREVSRQIYVPGLYFLGVGHYFITIPRTFQTVSFSGGSKLTSRTKDGLALTLEMTFQYRVEENKLFSIFDKFSTNYPITIVQIARDTIRDTASQYNAIQFFSERRSIGNQMESDLRTSINTMNVTLEFFQLQSVDLPNSYEAIVEQKEIQRQEILKAQYVQTSSLISAETNRLVALKDAQITEIQAAADAQGIIYNADANANQTASEVSAYITAFQDLKTKVGFTTNDLVVYSWVDAVKNHQSSKLTVNLDKPVSLNF